MYHFPPEVSEELKSYVYLYSDPRDGAPFYVGKGVGNRAFSHLADQSESGKLAKMQAIRISGHEPQIEILRHGLTDDQAALVEAAAIDLLGLDKLTNRNRGLHAKTLGRVSTADVLLSYAAKPVECADPLMLITINKLYRSDMAEKELYEATRGIWKVGERRQGARYACAVYQGVIRETYLIESWQPAGTHAYRYRDDSSFATSGRWEFTGQKAPPEIRTHYNRRSVKHLLGKAQFPVRYINC